MSDKKELELEKIRKSFKEGVLTEQEKSLLAALNKLRLSPEVVERILTEFSFQTSPFEVAFFIITSQGEDPADSTEDRLTSMKGHKFKFTRFTSIEDAVTEALKTAWIDNWFQFKWISQNSSVYLLPELATDITELGKKKTKTLYEDGIYIVKKEDKLITHLDRPLASARQEPVEF